MDDIKSVNRVQVNNAGSGEYEISIPQILGILKHKKGWIILCFILAVGAALGYLKVTVPTYEASASVLVNPLSSNASSIESLLSTSSSSSTNIATEVQLITANKTLFNALDLLDLTEYTDSEGIPYSEKEFTAKSLTNMVSVSTVNSTKIVSIKVSNQNADFCADYANAVAQAYSTLLVEISKNSKSAQREFLESQIPVTEELLTQASDAYALYREESGIIQMTEKSSVLTKTIAGFQMQMEPLKLQQMESMSLVESLSEQLGLSMSVDAIAADETVSKLVEAYKSSVSELIMYKNVSDEETSRIFVLESSISSSEKDILNAVSSIAGGMNNSSFAKAVADCICVGAKIEVLEEMEERYNDELSQYPVLERQLLEYQRDVEIYESLLLTLREMLEEARMLEAAEVGNVTIIDSATVPVNPVSPKKLTILAVAVIAGIAVGAGLAIVYDFLDDSIRSEDSIRSILGKNFPSLGWTMYIKDVEKVKAPYPRLFVYTSPDAAVSERFRAISNNIVYSTPDKVQVLSINSTDIGEGKTTAICNIAASYALVGKKVLIIDGDFRKPALEAAFNLKRSKVGFVDAVIKDVPLEKCIVRPVADIPNLHILPPGRGTRNPNALYNSEKFEVILEKLRKVYDYVIIDCPPLSYGSEFTHLAKHLDGFVLNIRAGVASKSAIAEFAKNLEFIKAPLLGYIYYGVVAKNQSSYGSHGHYGSYGYGYSYGSKKYGYGYGYGYGKTKDNVYTEGTGSYKKIYKAELKKRKEDGYGKNEPVLAFAQGAEAAFSSNLEDHEGSVKKTAVKPVIRPAVKTQTSSVDVTSDMLSMIEKDYSKKS